VVSLWLRRQIEIHEEIKDFHQRQRDIEINLESIDFKTATLIGIGKSKENYETSKF